MAQNTNKFKVFLKVQIKTLAMKARQKRVIIVSREN